MPISLPTDLMVSVSGFRGKVGSCLTPELLASLAAGFGAFLREEGVPGPVYLGRDSRTSGEMFANAARSGLISVGCEVVDLGIVSTPTLLLAGEEGGGAGALGVTASHNPAEWNALKFAGGDGVFLDPERMGRFQTFLRDREIPRASWDRLGSVRMDSGAIDRHIDRILALPFLEVERIRARRFHVAIDCVNGAGGLMIPQLLESLGCRVDGIGLEADGRFPRDPEPTAANLRDLGALVIRTGAELGLALDPDVDRLSLVDEAGKALGEDLTLALCSAVVLRRRPGPVVTNLSTSRVVGDVAAAFGCRLVRSPVGEINVARRMERERAVIGGEGNGGVILPDLHLTRDAPLGCALILQHLVDTGKSLRGAALEWPSYSIVKTKSAFPRERVGEGYAALQREMPGGVANLDDGLRIDWNDRSEWLHLRPSGTEPIVRLIAEAPEEASASRVIEDAIAILAGVESLKRAQRKG
jgi:phosphomannomutase